MIKITVPATSANIGSGFDSAGIALNMYNTVYLGCANGFDIRSLTGADIPRDGSNLIFRAAKELFDAAGEPLDCICLREDNVIPFARGLGSSSACIAAGLLGANALLQGRFSTRQLIDIAARLEGHPDNVVPAFLGGFTISAIGTDGGVSSARFDIADDLDFVAFVPPFELPTSEARAALPKTVPHADAVFNLSRSALLSAAFATRDYELLREAARDQLHQPYRLKLIAGGEAVFRVSEELGALATYVSGAGPTIMAVVAADNREYRARIADEMKKRPETAQYEIFWLRADNSGAVVEETDEMPGQPGLS